MSAPAAWIEQVRLVPLSVIAAAVGMQPQRGGLSPCLACEAEQRGRHDARGPVGMREDELGWRCQRCHAGGDGLTLAALRVLGEARPADRARWGDVRAWCADRGWCDRDGRDDRRGHGGSAHGDAAPAPRPARPAPAPSPRRPPADEIAAVWATCLPVLEDVEVATWLLGRGLDPSAIEDLDLARALPADARSPRWAGTARASWARSGHRLVMPMFDDKGGMASLRARSVVPLDPGGLKGLAATGYRVAGLVLACPLARRMLAGDAAARELVLEVGLVVAEGEPDTLTWATRWGVDGWLERAPAVLGLVSGSWTPDVAARVPDGARVVVRTHHDEAGEKYAALVANTLGERGTVLRASEGA